LLQLAAQFSGSQLRKIPEGVRFAAAALVLLQLAAQFSGSQSRNP
jgi:hypothetical protein